MLSADLKHRSKATLINVKPKKSIQALEGLLNIMYNYYISKNLITVSETE